MFADITNIPVTVDEKEYKGGDLPPEAQTMLRHCVDLNRQKEELQFKLSQIEVAEHGFVAALQELVRKMQREAVNDT